MKTNFFELVAGLSLKGDLQLNIHQSENGNLTVSLLLSPANPKITGLNNLPPLLFKGSPQELDEKFFTAMQQPVSATSAFIANLETYQAALEKAKMTAKPEKDKAAKAGTESGETDEDTDEPGLFAVVPDDKEAKAEKKKRYEEAMQQIRELNGQMKYKEAIALMPDAEEYPDKAAEIKAKGDELRKRQQVLETLQQEV